ncbi:hypothetical protein QBC38DRAFT_275794 [Podospora fimiseda]|uniref:RING-type domain-containing protein n=1 Tax=Podospora fimiseda TaxID=252190 RepID=A0AAN7H7D5_9PEZI|nr:hypothetical protein QBC38DRAFT_275794 [Podospora fimiseda]
MDIANVEAANMDHQMDYAMQQPAVEGGQPDVQSQSQSPQTQAQGQGQAQGTQPQSCPFLGTDRTGQHTGNHRPRQFVPQMFPSSYAAAREMWANIPPPLADSSDYSWPSGPSPAISPPFVRNPRASQSSRTPSGYHPYMFARQGESSGSFSSYDFAASSSAGGGRGGFPVSGTFSPPQRLPQPSNQSQNRNSNFRHSNQFPAVPSGPRSSGPGFDRDFTRNNRASSGVSGSGISRYYSGRGHINRNGIHRSPINTRPSSSRSPPYRQSAAAMSSSSASTLPLASASSSPSNSSQDPRADSVDTIVISSGESSPVRSPSTPAPAGPSSPLPVVPTAPDDSTSSARPAIAPTSNPNRSGGPTREPYTPPVHPGPPTGHPNWRDTGNQISFQITPEMAREDLLNVARNARAMGLDESEEDEYIPDEDDEDEALRYMFNAEVGNLRGYQVLRGQLDTSRRIASRQAISELEKVKISDLPEKEQSCIICYNDFGVDSPEGINEQPLRLPKCKHVFGDNCIKKWFTESDSCPYCRDKLPSELVIPPGSAAMFEIIRRERVARTELAFGYTPRPPTAGSSSQAAQISLERGQSSRSAGEQQSPVSEASQSSRRMRLTGNRGLSIPVEQLNPADRYAGAGRGGWASFANYGQSPFASSSQQPGRANNPYPSHFHPDRQAAPSSRPNFGNGNNRRGHAAVVNGSTLISPQNRPATNMDTSAPEGSNPTVSANPSAPANSSAPGNTAEPANPTLTSSSTAPAE